MYYKIENKESKVYQDLYALRIKEMKIEEENKATLKDKIGLEYTKFLGKRGQQNLYRVSQYVGFCFTEEGKVDTRVWHPHPVMKEAWVPYLRTKEGKAMNEVINNLKGSWFGRVYDILGIKAHAGKFTLPYVEIAGDAIIVYLDDNDDIPQELIEITSVEFKALNALVNEPAI